MTTRERVVEGALSWLKTPYHHQGAIKGVGVDCAMLLVCVYRKCGLVDAIDPRPYSEQWMCHREQEIFLNWLSRMGKETDSPQPGDVLVWKYGRTFSHGAIVVDSDGTIVHAYKPAGMVVLGNMNDNILANREMKSFIVRGIQ